MKLFKASLLAVSVIGAAATLSACSTYDDGYYGRSSVSVGVATGGPGYYRDGRYYDGGTYRDRDGDGIPNRFDNHPNNPYRP